MHVSRQQADQIYSILIETIGAPNLDYLRWSFVHGVAVLHCQQYQLDSQLGPGVTLNDTGPALMIRCDEPLDSVQARMVARANAAIAAVLGIAFRVPICHQDQPVEMSIRRDPS